MNLKNKFSRHIPYSIWLVVSAGLLACAWAADPYIFGFSAFAAAGISIILTVISIFFGIRPLIWAVTSSIPTILSFSILSTYKWA